MRIKSKIESLEAIKKLGLNQFYEIFLNGFEEQKIKLFLEDTKAEWYTIRDKTTAASPKAKTVKLDEVIDYCRGANIDKFTVCVSFRNYREHQICVGEIRIHGDTIDYFLSNNPTYSPRDLLKDPDHSGTSSIFDKRLRRIKGLEIAMDYAFEHNLVNVIVEFFVFNCNVGTKNEKIIIDELRTDY